MRSFSESAIHYDSQRFTGPSPCTQYPWFNILAGVFEGAAMSPLVSMYLFSSEMRRLPLKGIQLIREVKALSRTPVLNHAGGSVT